MASKKTAEPKGPAGPSTSRKEGGIRGKLKGFFSIKQDEGGLSKYSDTYSFTRHQLSKEILQALSPEGGDCEQRLRALESLQVEWSRSVLEPGAVENLWLCVRDLVDDPTPSEIQTETTILLVSLTQNQVKFMSEPVKALFMTWIKDNSNDHNLTYCLAWVKQLTDNGKEIVGMEDMISTIMNRWCHVLGVNYCNPPLQCSYLNLLCDLMQYNAAFFEHNHLINIVTSISQFAAAQRDNDEQGDLCLKCLEKLMTYGYIPREVVLPVTVCACRLVNWKSKIEPAWQFMRTLLASHIGHSVIVALCHLVQSSATFQNGEPMDAALMRGAVYFIGMGLWGSQRVETLRHTPASVLPSFLLALEANSDLVSFEVIKSLHRLVNKYGRELQMLTWDLVLRLLTRLVQLCNLDSPLAAVNRDPVMDMEEKFHSIISMMESLEEQGSLGTTPEQLYSLVEMCSRRRPECSVIRLLSYRANNLNSLQGDWIIGLNRLLDVYYVKECRTGVRISCINMIRNAYMDRTDFAREQILNQVLLPSMVSIGNERDSEVQGAAINLLCDVARTLGVFWDSDESYMKVIQLIDKVINKGLLAQQKQETCESLLLFLENIERSICALIELLEAKWNHWPPVHALLVLKLLISHVNIHYDKGLIGHAGYSIREQVLSCLFRLRIDCSCGKLGLNGMDSKILFSPYIRCDPYIGKEKSVGRKEGCFWVIVDHAAYFFWDEICRLISISLAKERFWSVIKCVMENLPEALMSRLLVLTASSSIQTLCLAVSSVVTDLNNTEKLINCPENLTCSEFGEALCPALSALLAYSDQIDEETCKKMIGAVQHCLVSEKSVNAVSATIICTLEVPQAMTYLMGDLVERLADLPSVPRLAIPLMELLSTVMRMDILHKHLKEQHYAALMDLLIPYTDVFLFNPYTVSLSNHLVYRWFLKAPIACRPKLAKHILSKYEQLCMKSRTSSDANRSERSSSDLMSSKLQEEMFATLRTFLRCFVLSDTPVSDMFATFDPVQEWMKSEGNTKNWLINDRLISISTLKEPTTDNNLCHSCRQHISRLSERIQSPIPGFRAASPCTPRRRHMSALQARVTRVPSGRRFISRDDSCIDSGTADWTHTHNPLAGHKSVTFLASGSIEALQGHNMLPLCHCWCKGFVRITQRHALGLSDIMMRINGQNMIPTSSHHTAAWAMLNLSSTTSCAHESRPSTTDVMVHMDSDLNLDEKETEENNSRSSSAVRAASFSARSFNAAPINTKRASMEADSVTAARIAALSNRHSMAQLSVDVNCSPSVWTNDPPPSAPLSSTSSFFSVKSRQPSADYRVSEIDPAHVFFSLCLDGANSSLNPDDLRFIPNSESFLRSMRNLDRMWPCEVIQIGVVFVGPRQTKQADILANQFGSDRYMKFLNGLGSLVSLTSPKAKRLFVGGLDTCGKDGMYTYHWSDPITHVVFHVATLMPNSSKDMACHRKRSFIGNDNVVVVFNEGGANCPVNEISGEHNYVTVLVEPQDSQSLAVTVHAKDEICRWLWMKKAVIRDPGAALFCRQLAMRADLSARIWHCQSSKPDQPFLSESIERLRHIREVIKEKHTFHKSDSTKSFLDMI